MKNVAFALLAAAFAVASAPALGQDYTDYEQCLIDRCFGNYEGDPVGYERCRKGCAALYPPEVAPQIAARLD